MAQTRNAFIKLKDAIKDLETMTSQDPEMYYRTQWPGLYIAEGFANIPGHISILQDYVDDAEEEREMICLWDSTWEISRTLSGPVVNMAEKAGIRVHGVLVLEAELLECMTILHKPAEGPGVHIHVRPFTERDGYLLDYAAGQGPSQRPDPQGLTESRDGIEPVSNETGGEASGEHEDRGTSFQDNRRTWPLEVNQATFLCCRRDDSGKYEYLIVDDAQVYHSRWPRFIGVSFDDEDGDFTRMHEEGPKEPHWPLKLNEHSSVEISPFAKGYTIRFIACGLKSRGKQVKSTSGETLYDISFHVICTGLDGLLHRDYEVGADGVSEGENYPQWHDGIAQHNENVWNAFVAQLVTLVKDAGGSWSDKRP